MAGLNYNTVTGSLVINGVSMHCPAWTIVDLRDLWLTPAVRGADRVIPYVNGARPYRRRPTVTPHSLPIVIAGLADLAGTAPSCTGTGAAVEAAIMEQLEDNIDYLRANVIDPTGTGDGTRAATLTMPSGAVRAANIHVLELTVGSLTPIALYGTLDVSIPQGAFV